jgi:anti-sigma B factor antagonist
MIDDRASATGAEAGSARSDAGTPDSGVSIWGSQVFDQTVVLRVSGELDLHGAADLRSVLEEQINRGNNVMLDLGNVEFIDSTGIGVLLDAVRGFALNDRTLKLYRSLRPQVRRLLMFTGANELIQRA